MSKILPPLSQFPSARNHPRSEELIKHNDEFFLERWPFNSQSHRDYFVRCKYALFTAKVAPDGNFEKMIWLCRMGTLQFLIDDELDTNLVCDSKANKFALVQRLKHIVAGTKKPNPGNYVEAVTNTVYRALETGCDPQEFDRTVRFTEEYYDAHTLPPCENLDQYIYLRRVTTDVYPWYALMRSTLEIHLRSEYLSHPLVKKCEDLAAETAAFDNDLISFTKEKLTNSAENNLITMLQRFEGLPSEATAISRTQDMVTQGEAQLRETCELVLADPVLGTDPEVLRYVLEIPYLISGNRWWSQYTARYNFPGHPVPRTPIYVEGVGGINVPDPYPNTELEQIVNCIPIARGESVPIITKPTVSHAGAQTWSSLEEEKNEGAVIV